MSIKDKIRGYFETEESYQDFHNKFLSDSKVRELQTKAFNLQSAGMLVQALRQRQIIDEVELRTIETLRQEESNKAHQISLLHAGLTKTEQNKVTELIITAYMLIDMIESCDMDINSILKKHDKEMSFDGFAEIKKLGKQAKQSIDWIGKNTNLYKNIEWGDYCDNLLKMTQNKARKLIKLSDERNKPTEE